MAQSRINIEEENRKLAQEKRIVASDSLQKFQLQVLELDNNNEVAGELGPLQYLSGLTGTPMDKIINWLLLIIIFVFDPLAISLVIAANFAFAQAYPKKKYKENLYGEYYEDKFSEWGDLDEEDYPLPNKDLTKAAMEFEVKDYDFNAEREDERKHWENITGQIRNEKIQNEEELEKRMNIIGQNGNEGEHYDQIYKEFEDIDLNKDGIISQSELIEAKQRVKVLENSIKGITKSSNRVDKALKEIKKLKGLISRFDDDLTKRY
jgi:Ca2+-binding EF-hand superfamily protein